MAEFYHIPVLLRQSVQGLRLFPGASVVDATYGGGGHAELILSLIGDGKLYAFDQDEDAVRNIIDDDRLVFIRHNFRYIKQFLRYFGVSEVDAVLADLGVSSYDFDIAERGFSFRFDDKLDMRMNRSAKVNAADVVNNYSEERLTSLFRMYGEIKNSKRLAREIVIAGGKEEIATTGKLREIALRCAPPKAENNYLARVFQALRIEVNDEMEALKEFLTASCEMLVPGGRLVVISYHSLEDRLCKNYMKTGNFEGRVEKDFYGNVLTPFKLINRKVIVPDAEEREKNIRSRSAKMRVAEKI